jgi:integrase
LSLGGVYEDHGIVFAGPIGRPLDPSVLTRNFQILARKAGLRLRLHDLRHGHVAAGLQAEAATAFAEVMAGGGGG